MYRGNTHSPPGIRPAAAKSGCDTDNTRNTNGTQAPWARTPMVQVIALAQAVSSLEISLPVVIYSSDRVRSSAGIANQTNQRIGMYRLIRRLNARGAADAKALPQHFVAALRRRFRAYPSAICRRGRYQSYRPGVIQWPSFFPPAGFCLFFHRCAELASSAPSVALSALLIG